MPAISILMSVYNAATSLPSTLDSIVSQSYTDWELIAVDDGSTDGSLVILQSWSAEDQRIKVLPLAHHGIVDALNVGLEHVTAPLIARMDADDVMHTHRLEKQYDYMLRNPDVGVVSSLVRHVGDESQKGYARHVAWINGLISHEEMAVNRFVDAPIANPSVMFRAECIRDYGGYRKGDFPEDYEFWLRWLEAGVRMAKVPEVLLDWHDGPGRITRHHPMYRDEAFTNIKAPYLMRWLEQHNPYHPQVVVWGAGRKSRKRLQPLLDLGLKVVAYIDIKSEGRQLDAPVINYRNIGTLKDVFVLSIVNKIGAQKEICEYLEKHDFVLGKNFIVT
ncbi:MAG: glycosyltransferase family 2 protein [Bacteroidia bacterium]